MESKKLINFNSIQSRLDAYHNELKNVEDYVENTAKLSLDDELTTRRQQAQTTIKLIRGSIHHLLIQMEEVDEEGSDALR